MSYASDILKAAITRAHQQHAEQATRVDTVCGSFAEMIKRPWKSRVEAIGEAVATVKQITEGIGGKAD